MKITAAELLADKRNTRAVLAAEVEELNDINDRLNYDYDRLDEQAKKAIENCDCDGCEYLKEDKSGFECVSYEDAYVVKLTRSKLQKQ